MAKWRPEGWEKIVDAITSKILDFEGHDGDPELVEAGADAMLDALKDYGRPLDSYKAPELIMEFVREIWAQHQYKPGTLVFVPDEEEK